MEQNVNEELTKLEDQFVDMQRTLEKIKEKISSEPQVTIDFNYLEKEAESNIMADHPISGLDKELVYRYCLALAFIAEMSENNDARIKQYYYIFRVYHAAYDDLVGEELVRDAKLIALADLCFIKENYSSEQMEYFFVDVLLLFAIGNEQDKQMDLFCELAAFLGISKKQINLICLITKAILEKDEDALLEVSREKDINAYYSYLGYIPQYYVVSKISEIESVSNDSVLVFGDKIQDINEVIDFDSYGKKELYFKKCCFDNILGIKSENENTKIHFIDCRFENCRQENLSAESNFRYEGGKPTTYFLKCKNAQIINTVFDNCNLLGVGKRSKIFDFRNSSIMKCKFVNCHIGVSVRGRSRFGGISSPGGISSLAKGSVISAVDTSIVNCEIISCSAHGEDDYYGDYDYLYGMTIVSIRQGQITGTKFISCKSKARHSNYILVFNDRCKEKNNDFIDCEAKQVNHGRDLKIQRN